MNKVLTPPGQSSTVVPMIIIGILFFIFGFVTWLNGALIPFLQIVCELNEFQALLVTFAFYIAYTVMALPMSFLLNVIGYKKGMLAGLLIMAVGALLFIPAENCSISLSTNTANTMGTIIPADLFTNPIILIRIAALSCGPIQTI